ncbi:hypothetical protein YDYSY3_59420 [Paenibacillus chitinolyticus]|nr:hypothetical protein YDYSY3_59420 [Paenibacillus chitinolyticus]
MECHGGFVKFGVVVRMFRPKRKNDTGTDPDGKGRGKFPGR